MLYPEDSVLDSPISKQVQRSCEGYSGGIAATLSDTVNETTPFRALIVKTTGDYKVTMLDGTAVTVTLAAGYVHPLMVKRVWLSGAAATTGIIGLV